MDQEQDGVLCDHLFGTFIISIQRCQYVNPVGQYYGDLELTAMPSII